MQQTRDPILDYRSGAAVQRLGQRANLKRATCWFGGIWLVATAVLFAIIQLIDEDAGYASLLSLLLGIVFIAVAAGAIAFPFAFFAFFWFGIHRRRYDAA